MQQAIRTGSAAHLKDMAFLTHDQARLTVAMPATRPADGTARSRHDAVVGRRKKRWQGWKCKLCT